MSRRTATIPAIFALVLCTIQLAPAQQQPAPQQPPIQPQGTLNQQGVINTQGLPTGTTTTPLSGMEAVRPTYVLGPGDQIVIRAFDVDEISNTPYRIDTDGQVDLPILGKIRAGGLTVEQLEADLIIRLRGIVQRPQVVVNVVQYRSEFVFALGAFQRPGMITLQGRRTLLEVLAAAGGPQPNASHRIRVTRRLEYGPIPLPNAQTDEATKTSTVEIPLGALSDNINPAEDIVMQPFDRVNVDRAEMVYVTGEVGRVGGVELGERESISVTQILTIAGGLGKDAKPSDALVLRPILNTSRRAQIPINLKRILSGQDSDFPLLSNDVLVIPRSSGKRYLTTGLSLVALPLIPTLLYLLIR